MSKLQKERLYLRTFAKDNRQAEFMNAQREQSPVQREARAFIGQGQARANTDHRADHALKGGWSRSIPSSRKRGDRVASMFSKIAEAGAWERLECPRQVQQRAKGKRSGRHGQQRAQEGQAQPQNVAQGAAGAEGVDRGNC